MFGYLRINKPELKICDYQTYKGVYCSLCKEMGKKFGLISRFTLSYDFAFLALLRMSVNSNCNLSFKKSRCTFNPMHKCLKCSKENENIVFAVYMSILMLYYKINDNIKDSKIFKRSLMRFLYPIVNRYYKKVLKKYKELDIIVSSEMDKQSKLESDKCTDIDSSSNPTATMLGKIFSNGSSNENQKRILYHLGYLIGRYIYILDAVEDFEKDYKHEEYNTFVLLYNNGTYKNIKEYKVDVEMILNRTLSQIINTYELLEIKSNKNILDNIIFEGLAIEMNRVLKKEVMV